MHMGRPLRHDIFALVYVRVDVVRPYMHAAPQGRCDPLMHRWWAVMLFKQCRKSSFHMKVMVRLVAKRKACAPSEDFKQRRGWAEATVMGGGGGGRGTEGFLCAGKRAKEGGFCGK